MNLVESYLLLFSDSFFSAFILTPRSEMVVSLMSIFTGYNLYLIFILALAGSMLGSVTNWQIGKCFLFLHKTNFFQKKLDKIQEAEIKWQSFLVYILLFSWIGAIGGPFAVLAGFFRTKILKLFLLIFCGKFCYYYLLIFYNLDLLKL